MDIFNIFKLFSENQRELLICFIVLLPCHFTLLFLYVPIFLTVEFYYQGIIAAAATITMMYISNSFIALSNIIAKSNVYNPVAILTVNLGIFAYLLYANEEPFTKEYFANVVVIANGFTGTSFIILFSVHRYIENRNDKGC